MSEREEEQEQEEFVQPCDKIGKKHEYEFSRYCGCKVCNVCGDHKGLARCYCGWSKTDPGRGREELIEMGETIEPEDY